MTSSHTMKSLQATPILHKALTLYRAELSEETARASTLSNGTRGAASLSRSTANGHLALTTPGSKAIDFIDSQTKTKHTSWTGLASTFNSTSPVQGQISSCSWSADGKLLIVARNGAVCIVDREGCPVRKWAGASAQELNVAATWLDVDSVAVLTAWGNVYRLPSMRGPPVQKIMQKLQDLHRFFHCIAYIPEHRQIVIVGDNGRTAQAQTSQQLAAALSVSIWDASNMDKITVACFCGIKQGMFSRAGRVSALQEGWDLAVSPGGLAITTPSRKLLVYSLQTSGAALSLMPIHSLAPSLLPAGTPAPPPARGQQTMENEVLMCSSNAVWWAPDQLAFVAAQGNLQVLHVPSGEQLLSVNTHYFLPGSRVLADSVGEGELRRLYVWSALPQASKPLSKRMRGKNKQAPSVMRKWYLVNITELTPTEELYNLLDDSSWDAALSLAQQYQLPSDDVYKSRWLKEGFSSKQGLAVLQHVQDDAWALQQCLTHVAGGHAEQAAVLQHGLVLTSRHSSASQAESIETGEEGSEPGQQSWWIHARLRLLEHTDCLHTYMHLCDRQFEQEGYRRWHQQTLEEAACECAQHAALPKLMLLLQRHPHRLLPKLLTVLGQLPETTEADVYADLFSQTSQVGDLCQGALQLREADWVEISAVCKAVSVEQPRLAYATEHLASLQPHCTPPTPHQIADWLAERAEQVERVTGMLSLAAELLQLAQQTHPQQKVGFQLALIQSLQEALQDVHSEDEAWSTGLAAFQKLEPLQQLLFLIPPQHADASAAAGTAQRVARYLAAVHTPHRRQHLLVRLVAEDPAAHLVWLVHIFERLRLQQQVFVSRGQLGKTALACVSSCIATDQWGGLVGLLQGAQAALEGQAEPELQSLAQEMRQVEGQCKAGQMLAALGLDLSLAGLQAATAKAAKDLLLLLLKQIADTQPPLLESRWAVIEEEVKEAVALGLPVLSPVEVQEQLFRAVLRCGHFNLVKKYMSGSNALPRETATKVVAEVAHSFFCAAKSLEAEEIGLGSVTLTLLPDEPRVQEEGKCLKALQELQDWGITILPAEYYQVKDKMDLLSHALSQHPKAYSKPDAVHHLANLLGLQGRARAVQLRMGQAALQHGALQAAQQTCLQLMEADYKPVWRLCRHVMRRSKQGDGTAKTQTRLLSYAIQYAPADRLGGLLAHLRYVNSGYVSYPPSTAQPGSPTTRDSSPSPTTYSASPVPPSTLPSSAQHAQRAHDGLQSALAKSKAGVTGRLDAEARLAVGHLCVLRGEAWGQLQGLIDAALSPQQAQLLLLVGMQAAALQALRLEGGSFEDQMQCNRVWLAASPWHLLGECSQLQAEGLPPDRATALKQCRQYASLLRQQEDSLQVQQALPAGKLQLFIGAGSSSEAYRSEQLLQLCTQAAQEEDIHTGQGCFQQALALAQKYNSPTWDLHFQYLHSLMLHWQHASSVIVPLVKDLFPALMQQPHRTVQCSLLQTWPELQGQRQLHVAFALKLLEKCFQWVQTSSDPEVEPVLLELQSSMSRLALLQDFARRLGQTAPGLDIKPFIVPCLPLQLLLLLLPEVASSDDGTAASQQQEALAALYSHAVQELCDHTDADNVEDIASCIASLPLATLANAALPVLRSQTHMSIQGNNGQTGSLQCVSSSTAYTACAAGTWFEMSRLDTEEQAEASQHLVDYFPRMTPQHTTQLLLWGVLEQPHPLLPSGPQLPSSALSEQLRLKLLQAGLAQLKRPSQQEDSITVDHRLELEAQRLAVLCQVQTSCKLDSVQQACVTDALTSLTSPDSTGTAGSNSAAVDTCIVNLITADCDLTDVFCVTDCMLSMLRSTSDQATEQLSSPAADRVQSVLLARLDDNLQTIADLPPDTAAAAGSNGLTGHGRPQEEQDVQSRHQQAAAFIQGVLHSLQQPGKAGTAQQLVSSLRAQVWQKLQRYLLPTGTQTDSASLNPLETHLLEAMLQLADNADAAANSAAQASSPSQPQAPPRVIWVGWRGPEGGDTGLAQAQQVLMLSRSKALMHSGWPDAAVTAEDLASLEGLQKLFMKLLAQETSQEQLQLLQSLLEVVWHSGRDSVTAEGEPQELSSNPLHSCWAALLKRFMAAGDSHSVLRALDANQALHDVSGEPWQGSRSCLLTQPEMEDLVESAYSSGHQDLAVMTSLLQAHASMTTSAMQHLSAHHPEQPVQPDPMLLCLLLHRGLFEEISGTLQAALVRVVRGSPDPPAFLVDNTVLDANSIMLPSLVAHFARQGCYAQAAELCAYHTCLHPAYYTFSAGLQTLQPYLHAQRQHDYTDLDVVELTKHWPIPRTLMQLAQSLSSSAEHALQRMSQDHMSELL